MQRTSHQMLYSQVAYRSITAFVLGLTAFFAGCTSALFGGSGGPGGIQRSNPYVGPPNCT